MLIIYSDSLSTEGNLEVPLISAKSDRLNEDALISHKHWAVLELWISHTFFYQEKAKYKILTKSYF